jgi:hypothetical protein
MIAAGFNKKIQAQGGRHQAAGERAKSRLLRELGTGPRVAMSNVSAPPVYGRDRLMGMHRPPWRLCGRGRGRDPRACMPWLGCSVWSRAGCRPMVDPLLLITNAQSGWLQAGVEGNECLLQHRVAPVFGPTTTSPRGLARG